MGGVVMTASYPNPGSQRTWSDHRGRVWHRKGKRGDSLDERQVRQLSKNPHVSIAVWSAGEVTWFEAADPGRSAGLPLGDVRASEWRADDGGRLLMLGHFC